MRHIKLLRLARAALLSALLASCGPAADPSARTGGLPIDPRIEDLISTGRVCSLRGDLRPLEGIVRIDLADPELVWVERLDHSRASVRWPTGFWLDHDGPAVRDVRDRIVARDGTPIVVDTLQWWAKGTSTDPFVLLGDINGRCYG